MKRKRLLFLFGFLMMSFTALSQVTFEAKVSKNQLGINERLRIDFEMNQDGDNFRPPSFENFRIVGGPNQAISNSFINGKRSFSKTYSYFLSPQSRGKLTIGQATIEIDGQVYKTSPITVEVTEAVETPKDGNNLDYVASENVHLIAEISNSNPYLNEAITVTYKLYVSHDVGINYWREIDSPKYADFWSQAIENQDLQAVNTKYKGKDYRYITLRTVVLYPQKTGELEIEPLTLDVPVDVPGTRRTFFGNPIVERVNKTISAGKRTIRVKPLPADGKPDNFSGAVGDFKFEAIPSKTKLSANESLELELKVSGKGNLKLFQLPKFKLPNSLEVYEPERKEDIRTQSSGMQGWISESYTIVPQQNGNFPIPSLSFSFFNPKTGRYQTLSSEGFTLNVEGAAIASSGIQGTTPKNQVVLSENDFKYIKLDTKLHAIEKEPFFRSPLFWSLVGSPILLIPILIFAGRKRQDLLQDEEGLRLRAANRLAKKYLTEARKNMSNPEKFYEALERALHNYLKAKLHLETGEMEKDHISRLLQDRNVSPDTVHRFVSLLQSCEFARYASVFSNESVKSDYEKSVSIISEIDKQFK